MTDHDQNDPLEDDGADLLGDMAAATFSAPEAWWRQFVTKLDERQLEQLRAGELRVTTMGPTGMETVPLVAPRWLFEDESPPPAA